MPVRSAGIIDMMFNAGLQTARAESTADIYVKTGFEAEGADFADVDGLINRGGENQDVRAGMRMHEISEPTLEIVGKDKFL